MIRPKHAAFPLLLNLLLTGTCSAEQIFKWMEIIPNGDSPAIYYKHSDEKRSWALGLSRLGDTLFLGDDTYTDKANDRSFAPSFTVLSAAKLWHRRAAYSYADFGMGLGIGSGSWAESCERTGSNMLSSHYDCNKREGTHLGLQLLASVAVGHRLGIGYGVDVFVHRQRSHAKLMMIFALGRFAPKPSKKVRVHTLPMQ